MTTKYSWQTTVQDARGNVEPGASMEVRKASDNTLATLYEDAAGMTPLSNPTDTDSDGYVLFYLDGGTYNITATVDAFSFREWPDVLIGAAPRALANVQNITLTTGENLDIELTAAAEIVRLLPDAAGSTLVSIDATDNARRSVILINVGTADAQAITIPHLSGSGQVGNLFSNPGAATMIIPYGASLAIWLDDGDADTVWRII